MNKKNIAKYYENIKLLPRFPDSQNFVKELLFKTVKKKLEESEVPFSIQNYKICQAFLFESTILFERALSFFMAAKYQFHAGHLIPGYLNYYISDLNSIMGISHLLGFGRYYFRKKIIRVDSYSVRIEDIGRFVVERIDWIQRRYEIRQYRGRGPLYRLKYTDFFSIASRLYRGDYTDEEWNTLKDNDFTRFYKSRDIFTYNLSSDMGFLESIFPFLNNTEKICKLNRDFVFITPYFEEYARADGASEEALEYLNEIRSHGFLQEQTVAYHLKILIDLLKEIGSVNPDNGVLTYLNGIKNKISSDFYKTDTCYKQILSNWLEY